MKDRRGSTELFAKPDTRPLRLIDSATGSEWDFEGRCTAGRYAGQRLRSIHALRDYWFDWKSYNRETLIYR